MRLRLWRLFWMDIATRRKKNKTIKIENNNKGYDYMEFNRRMFDKHEYNTSIKEKGKMTICRLHPQKRHEVPKMCRALCSQ